MPPGVAGLSNGWRMVVRLYDLHSAQTILHSAECEAAAVANGNRQHISSTAFISIIAENIKLEWVEVLKYLGCRE